MHASRDLPNTGLQRDVWLRRTLWLLGAAAAVLAALLLVGRRHQQDKLAVGVLAISAGCSFIASGLIAWTRRPANRIGPLMVLIGFVWLLGGGLQESNDSLPFTLGVLIGNVAFAPFVHVLLSFPSGELGRRKRLLVWLAWFAL